MRRCRALAFSAVLLFSAGCDHVSKQIARDVLTDSGAVSLGADTIHLEFTQNLGGFLSLGVGLPAGLRSLFFLAIVPLGLLLACVLFLRAGFPSGVSLIGLGLIAGGGLANWLDRVAHGGAVTDFVGLRLGPIRTGIFNAADVSVVVGALVLLLAYHAPGGARRSDTARGRG